MKFISLASSSSGNSTLISNDNINILIDCGISSKKLNESLNNYNLSLDDISYCFITHSHSDHIAGLYNLIKNYNIKIYGLRETLSEIIDYFKNKNLDTKSLNYDKLFVLDVKNTNDLNDYIKLDNNFYISPNFCYHDVECVFYKIVIDDIKIAILTDCGKYDDYIINSIKDVNYLMLESNYDYQKLMNNQYPDFLKKRIRGDKGHLSNIDCAEIISKIINENLKIVCLSHISEHSNDNEFALKYVTDYLIENLSNNVSLPQLITAKKNEITNIII